MAVYMPYSTLAVLSAFGTSLETIGPVLSALTRLIWEPLAKCIIADMNTRMPIPPIQCRKLLHISSPLGSDSRSVSTVAPVVVNPDTVSKNASIGLVIAPDIRNGSIPVSDSVIHVRPVDMKPSLETMSLSLSAIKYRMPPTAPSISMGIINSLRSSPCTTEQPRGSSMSTASKSSAPPIIFPISFGFMAPPLFQHA